MVSDVKKYKHTSNEEPKNCLCEWGGFQRDGSKTGWIDPRGNQVPQ